MADASPRTDISTDGDTDDKNQLVTFCFYLSCYFLALSSVDKCQIHIPCLHILEPFQIEPMIIDSTV